MILTQQLGMAGMSEVIIADIVNKAINNQFQIMLQLVAKYDSDTIALLEGLEGRERTNFVMRVKAAYVTINLEIMETQALIDRNEKRISGFDKAALERKEIEEGEHCKDSMKWVYYNVYCDMWLKIYEALLREAKSQYAFLRPIGIIQAYEAAKKRGMVFGKTGDAIKDIQKQLHVAKDEAKDEPRFTKEENEAARAVGLDPSTVLPKPEEAV